MRTAEVRLRMEVLHELGVLTLFGDQHADPVQAASLYLPPFRERLRDGRLGPAYGLSVPSRWHRAWVNWRQSRAGGGLWDAEIAWGCQPRRQVAPAAQPALELDVYLSRYGHELTRCEGEVASLRWRDHLKTPAIARRTQMKTSEVDGLLRSVLMKFNAKLRTAS